MLLTTSFTPLFKHLDSDATKNKKKWKPCLKEAPRIELLNTTELLISGISWKAENLKNPTSSKNTLRTSYSFLLPFDVRFLCLAITSHLSPPSGLLPLVPEAFDFLSAFSNNVNITPITPNLYHVSFFLKIQFFIINVQLYIYWILKNIFKNFLKIK